MVDFKSAVKDGFDAAEKAELARREVREVLARLKSDVLDFSGGRLSVDLAEFQRFRRPRTLAETFVDPTTVLGLRTPEVYFALAATNPKVKDSPTKDLAEWKQAANGYPCTLTWVGQQRQCEDREALEECLADLLRDPLIGEKLQSLMNLKSK